VGPATGLAGLLKSGEVFHVRSIFPDQARVSSGSFGLKPDTPQAEAVCSLFERFLANRPPSFHEPLTFLRKGDFALDWSSAPGGVALATLLQAGETASMSVLVAGLEPAADAMMLEAFRENVLEPLFDNQYDSLCSIEVRPLVLEVIFPGRPEWTPALQLFSVSLGCVYFRSLFARAGREPERLV
jgi:hypothetical protein